MWCKETLHLNIFRKADKWLNVTIVLMVQYSKYYSIKVIYLLWVKHLQRSDRGQSGPVVQQGVDVSHAGPVPAGHTGQHFGEAAGVVLPTVEPMVP